MGFISKLFGDNSDKKKREIIACSKILYLAAIIDKKTDLDELETLSRWLEVITECEPEKFVSHADMMKAGTEVGEILGRSGGISPAIKDYVMEIAQDIPGIHHRVYETKIRNCQRILMGVFNILYPANEAFFRLDGDEEWQMMYIHKMDLYRYIGTGLGLEHEVIQMIFDSWHKNRKTPEQK